MTQAAIMKIQIGSTELELVYVAGGTFEMGSNTRAREKPIHRVSIASFYIGKYPVTQSQYESIMGKNPSRWVGENRPVERVSWHDAQKFINQLNERKEIQQKGGLFRLPTESEWEYAARGGGKSQDYEYSGSDELKQVGWYRENSGDETKPIGLLYPNELGIYDMSGNVYEQCEDDWHENYIDAPDDGSAWIGTPSRGAYRVVRGGHSWNNPVRCRSAYRSHFRPDYRFDDVGFRLVFSPV